MGVRAELQEEIRDLLILDAHGGRRVNIREVPGGGICLAGATEKEVVTKTEMAELLSQGTLQRATASTNMNRHSSRSHAIFTITVEQRRKMQAAASRPDFDAEVLFQPRDVTGIVCVLQCAGRAVTCHPYNCSIFIVCCLLYFLSGRKLTSCCHRRKQMRVETKTSTTTSAPRCTW